MNKKIQINFFCKSNYWSRRMIKIREIAQRIIKIDDFNFKKNNFYTLRYPDAFSEDGSGTLELFFGTGIIQPVTVNLLSSSQVFFDGQQASNSILFSVDEIGPSHPIDNTRKLLWT